MNPNNTLPQPITDLKNTNIELLEALTSLYNFSLSPSQFDDTPGKRARSHARDVIENNRKTLVSSDPLLNIQLDGLLISKSSIRDLSKYIASIQSKRALVYWSDIEDSIVKWLEQNPNTNVIVDGKLPINEPEVDLIDDSNDESFNYDLDRMKKMVESPSVSVTEVFSTFECIKLFGINWDNAPDNAEEACILLHWGDKDSNFIKSEILLEENRPLPVKKDQVWKYLNTGNKYTIICVGDLKNDEDDPTPNWIDSVTYQCNNSKKFYTRSLTKFLEKFERVV